jgi:antitoxin (DNA-binding transcriptional repressor) of toxin-antitoxin stability system
VNSPKRGMNGQVFSRTPFDSAGKLSQTKFMIKVNTHEAKTRLSALLDIVVICRNGKPIADLVRHAEPVPQLSRRGMFPELKGTILTNSTLPLDEDAWPTEFR